MKQVLSPEEVAALLQGLAGYEPACESGKPGPCRGRNLQTHAVENVDERPGKRRPLVGSAY